MSIYFYSHSKKNNKNIVYLQLKYQISTDLYNFIVYLIEFDIFPWQYKIPILIFGQF